MNELIAFYDVYSLRMAQTLLHFLWQGAVIGTMVFLLDIAARQLPARTKYATYVALLVVMAACLPATFVWLGVFGTSQEPAVAKGAASVASASTATLDQVFEQKKLATDPVTTSGIDAEVFAHAEAAGAEEPPIGAAARWRAPADRSMSTMAQTTPAGSDDSGPENRSLLAKTARVITVLYAICVVCMLVRLAEALRGGHRLRASSKRVTDLRIVDSLLRQARGMGMRVIPVIAYCEQVSIPVVVGVVRPVILLPAALVTGLSTEQLGAVIAHELAHLRRYDPVVNLIQRLIEAVTFFHPAVWFVSYQIDVQREHAADDLVLATGWQKVNYAEALVHMAELSKQLRRDEPRVALAASGTGDSEFKRRVIRLLDGESSRVRLTNAGLAMFLLIVGSVLVAPFVVHAWTQPATSPSQTRNGDRIGRAIGDFNLRDFRGRSHSLSDFKDHKIVAVAFLGTECPLAKLYGKRLAELSRKFRGKGVAFLGVNSNQQDTPSELGHYARQHGVEFPLLKDPGNRVADLFQAQRTPEVFVLDEQRVVRYWGRIDDQFGVGYTTPAAKTHYLANAIEDLIAGREVGDPQSASVGCHIGRVERDAPRGDITYTSHVAQIMQSRCVECHRDGGIAPFGLESYEDVAAWSETMLEVVEDKRMPPWHANPKYGHFSNDARMPDEEKQLLKQWVENNVPRGNSKLPEPQEFTNGWLLGQPDMVLTMPAPFHVPATGVVDYQYVTIDPGFREGKWVRASEIRPGVRSVVHHIIAFINPPGGDPILEERGVGFESVGGYVPGAAPMQLPDGVARYVPPGSTFILQLHYTPDGTSRRDQSQIGLYFADAQTIHHTMQTGLVANLDFELPAHTRDHRVVAQHRFSHDMELHTLAPHMHFRGKAFRYEAIYPHGAREILLDVPHYDFNWQHAYQLASPKLMPEGTLLKCTAIFDNSASNLANPDPTRAVRWGDQTWDEMMVGFFEGIFLNQNMTTPEPLVSKVADGLYRVHFEYKPDRPAKTIHLSGTFNEWSTTTHPFEDQDGDGIYTIDLEIAEGEHRYKFVIDGNYWTHDPSSRILTGFLHESFFVAGTGNDTREAGQR